MNWACWSCRKCGANPCVCWRFPSDIRGYTQVKREEALDCICPCNVHVCPQCGRAWTHYMEHSDGQRTYTDANTVARYEALYGDAPFKAIASGDVR